MGKRTTLPRRHYFLFMGGSSIHMLHMPLGFLLFAFLMTVIFILCSLRDCADRFVGQRSDRRFHALLVTRRRIHVAKL